MQAGYLQRLPAAQPVPSLQCPPTLVLLPGASARFELLARLCPSATGADIRSVCTEAGMFAIRARRRCVTEEDFLKAAHKVGCGLGTGCAGAAVRLFGAGQASPLTPPPAWDPPYLRWCTTTKSFHPPQSTWPIDDPANALRLSAGLIGIPRKQPCWLKQHQQHAGTSVAGCAFNGVTAPAALLSTPAPLASLCAFRQPLHCLPPT